MGSGKNPTRPKLEALTTKPQTAYYALNNKDGSVIAIVSRQHLGAVEQGILGVVSIVL